MKKIPKNMAVYAIMVSIHVDYKLVQKYKLHAQNKQPQTKSGV
jgi:hypothetical protein